MGNYYENSVCLEAAAQRDLRVDVEGYYGMAEWHGTVYLWYQGIRLDRALYVCYAHNTDFHAVPIPQIYVLIEGKFIVEAEEWVVHLKSGEKLPLPAKDNKRRGVAWTRRSTQVELLPGQIIIVKSNYAHRLIGEGKIAILYPAPDSVEGQGLLARDDYEIGLAVTAPPKSEMIELLHQLSSLCGTRWKGAKEAANEVYKKIAQKFEPTSHSPGIVPAWLVSIGNGVRNRCRLKRYQCELNARIYLRDLADYVGCTPKGLEKVFRKHFKTRVCHYVRFLHQAAAMLYYATEQRRAWQEYRDVDIKMTDLAAEVHYLDLPQFTNDFHDFHGIAPVMFFPNTHFILIDMGAN